MSDTMLMDIREMEQTRDEFKDNQKRFDQYAMALTATATGIKATIFGNFAAALIAALHAAAATAKATAAFCGEFAAQLNRNIDQAKETEQANEKRLKAAEAGFTRA